MVDKWVFLACVGIPIIGIVLVLLYNFIVYHVLGMGKT